MEALSSIHGGRTLVPIRSAQTITLERGTSTEVMFGPGRTVIDFALVKPATPVEQRADIGIGTDHVVVKGHSVAITVHTVGSKDATGGRAESIDATG
ncbi:hypothetical protein ASF00_05745 [Sphingomonas sp. Leaf34]|nr:hypothetical protein ASF00_05745 [Sphingomonas sp. Leaf34]